MHPLLSDDPASSLTPFTGPKAYNMKIKKAINKYRCMDGNVDVLRRTRKKVKGVRVMSRRQKRKSGARDMRMETSIRQNQKFCL